MQCAVCYLAIFALRICWSKKWSNSWLKNRETIWIVNFVIYCTPSVGGPLWCAREAQDECIRHIPSLQVRVCSAVQRQDDGVLFRRVLCCTKSNCTAQLKWGFIPHRALLLLSNCGLIFARLISSVLCSGLAFSQCQGLARSALHFWWLSRSVYTPIGLPLQGSQQ